MPHTLPGAVAALLIAILVATGAAQPPPLSRQALAVQQKIAGLPPNAPISVLPTHAPEQYGNLLSSDAQGFTFYDVDRKANVTLPYAGIRKIKNGYGGYNSIQRRHTDRTKVLLITAAVGLGILMLIGAAVASK